MVFSFNLLFLAFRTSLPFPFPRNSLLFCAFFHFFPKDSRGLATIKNPCFFGWFSLPFSKKARKRRSGLIKYFFKQKGTVSVLVPVPDNPRTSKIPKKLSGD